MAAGRAESVGGALADGLRRLTCVLAAGWVAGFLVVGLGGRLVMRILGATSGDVAQGRLTDAEQVVGEITLGGTVGFVIFAGLLLPIAAACLYLPVRRFLPNRAWQSGLLYSVLLLATFGITDPLERDSTDFVILSPSWLGVVLVVATAGLFGITLPRRSSPHSALRAGHRAIAALDGTRGSRISPSSASSIRSAPRSPRCTSSGEPCCGVDSLLRGRRRSVRLAALGVGATACLVSLVVVGGVAVDLV